MLAVTPYRITIHPTSMQYKVYFRRFPVTLLFEVVLLTLYPISLDYSNYVGLKFCQSGISRTFSKALIGRPKTNLSYQLLGSLG